MKAELGEIRYPEDIFPSVGQPLYTYVERDQGKNERMLRSGLRDKGQICILTGPSKTGKTSLYKKVLPTVTKTELAIRCSRSMTPDQFWASALEDLDFSRIAESSRAFGVNVETKIGAQGEVGWSWLAKAMASVGFSVSGSGEYAIRREFARTRLSARHLIPLLKQLPVQLIVEDFHYLNDDVKVEIFQQWKSFTDQGVSVVVVSTTHRTVDIARANPDLTGRMRLIDVGKWCEKDLAEIPRLGFPLLDYTITEPLCSKIAKEAVGLPIIAQQICQQICYLLEEEMSEEDIVPVDGSNINDAQAYVADNFYSSHENDYKVLANGPRRRARRHATYEKILASFALEPLAFSLEYGELASRVDKLRLPGEDPIPPASIMAALRAIGNFQNRTKINLLEWQENERRLYILEPSFLFYLRQKLDNFAPGEEISAALQKFIGHLERLRMTFRKLPVDSPSSNDV